MYNLCNSFSDQTTAIPHWLWNQPSAPPVHPEDGVKGCLGNAVKVSEPQQMSSCHSQINLPRRYPLRANSRMLVHITLGWWFTVSIWSNKHHAIAKWYTLFKSFHQVWHVYKIMQLIQWSDKCHTSLAVESALCTTGSPRRWSQRVSRKCYESVGAANDVIMPLPYQLAKALPSERKIKNARSFSYGLMVHCFYLINKTSCKSRLIHAIEQ